MLTNKQVPVLNVTESSITSQADLQDAFQSLCLCSHIVDILKRLGKADNIPFNQLYYIAKNCADRYYSKVIETFVALLKHQFVDRQLLLVNTTGPAFSATQEFLVTDFGTIGPPPTGGKESSDQSTE